MANNSVTVRFFQKKSFVVVAVLSLMVVISVGAVRIASYKNNTGSADNSATFVVKRGPLRISVTESGTIKAREQVILRSEVEGTTSILWLIPEGATVKQGDLLVELDASQLVDNKIDQQIIVQNAEAAFIGARENLAVVENQAQSDIDIAELTLEFAKQDLKKYQEGEYPNQLNEAQSQITLAQEEVTRATEKLDWSKKLFEEKYISQTELQADQLALKKSELNLQLAKNNLELLGNYTYQRNMAQLESDVKQAGMALERTRRKAKADVAQAEADLKAKESEYKRQQDKLAKTEDQIKKARIYASADGVAIYATSARRGGWRRETQPLDVGQVVREREELIYLPTTSAVKAEVDIHEASLNKVRVGLPSIITVDALPGKVFMGHLAHIAPLPDAQSMWQSPDLKVYNAEVYLDSNDSALRTGMTCKAEVIVKEYGDAVYVPLQAVLRVAAQPTVYVHNGKAFEPRAVELGLDNNIMVRIISGLQESEVVLLTPPLKAAALQPTAEQTAAETLSYENGTEVMQRRLGPEPERETDNERSAERQERRMRFEDMSAEEREKLRERFRNMSPEERQEMRRRREGESR